MRDQGRGDAEAEHGSFDRSGLLGSQALHGRSSTTVTAFQVHKTVGGAADGGSSSIYGHHKHALPGGSGGVSDLAAAWSDALVASFGVSRKARTRQSHADEQVAGTSLQGGGLLRVESQGSRPGEGLDLGRSSPVAVPRSARLCVRPGLTAPRAKLANPAGMSLCCANAMALATHAC